MKVRKGLYSVRLEEICRINCEKFGESYPTTLFYFFSGKRILARYAHKKGCLGCKSGKISLLEAFRVVAREKGSLSYYYALNCYSFTEIKSRFRKSLNKCLPKAVLSALFLPSYPKLLARSHVMLASRLSFAMRSCESQCNEKKAK